MSELKWIKNNDLQVPLGLPKAGVKFFAWKLIMFGGK